MLTRVEVVTTQGKTLQLPLADYSNGVIVAGIEGLEPVKATLVSTSFANQDGEQYQSSRRESRNIKLQLQLDTGSPVGSVRDIRGGLYGYFMPKSRIWLRFFDSSGLRTDIEGRVESFESPLFAQEPTVDISIMCFDPDFYDPTTVRSNGQSVGSTAGSSAHVLDYKGTVETGVVFTLNVNRPMKDLAIYHQPQGSTLRTVDFTADMLAGDILQISTVPGDKYVTLTRNGIMTYALYGMNPSSNWIELLPGQNSIRVVVEGAPIPYTFEYTTKYGGL